MTKNKKPAYTQAIKELKQLINPVRGFQSMKTAYATIQGFEVMRMFKKGPFSVGCMVIVMKCLSLINDSIFIYKTIRRI